LNDVVVFKTIASPAVDASLIHLFDLRPISLDKPASFFDSNGLNGDAFASFQYSSYIRPMLMKQKNWWWQTDAIAN